MVFESILKPVDLSYTGNAVSGVFGTSPFQTSSEYDERELFVDAPSGESFTFSQFRDIVPKFAAHLQSHLGISQGDVLALFMPNNLYIPTIHLAVITLAGIVSPANVMYSAEELAHQFRVAKPKVAIIYDALIPTAQEAAKLAKIDSSLKLIKLSSIVPVIEKLRGDKSAPKISPVKVDGKSTPAYYCFSSGTSGLAKCVVTTHYNIYINGVQISKANPSIIGPDVGVSCVLPMSHIFALQTGIWSGTYLGNRTVIFPKFDISEFVSGVVKYQLNVLYLVPPILLALGKLDILDHHPGFKDCVKYAISGAAPTSKEIISLFNTKAPHTLVAQGYGLTETSPITHLGIAITPYEYDQSSIGWLVPGAKAQLVDFESGKVVDGYNQRGELWLKGPMVMKGYLNNPEANKLAFSDDGWFKTGDVAVVSKSKQFYIVDRIKELIKSNGHQVAPAELESILLSNPRVIDAAVIGVYNEMKTSENPRAYVVLAPGTKPEDIILWFNKRVAKHKRLWGGIVVVKQVPKSASGKILRNDLRKRVGSPEDVVVGAQLASL